MDRVTVERWDTVCVTMDVMAEVTVLVNTMLIVGRNSLAGEAVTHESEGRIGTSSSRTGASVGSGTRESILA